MEKLLLSLSLVISAHVVLDAAQAEWRRAREALSSYTGGLGRKDNGYRLIDDVSSASDERRKALHRYKENIDYFSLAAGSFLGKGAVVSVSDHAVVREYEVIETLEGKLFLIRRTERREAETLLKDAYDIVRECLRRV
ncbi:MAG: hypothetical protein AAB691_02600 [Patescibacteria group bacterium]